MKGLFLIAVALIAVAVLTFRYFEQKEKSGDCVRAPNGNCVEGYQYP